jgi:hypothetical protein
MISQMDLMALFKDCGVVWRRPLLCLLLPLAIGVFLVPVPVNGIGHDICANAVQGIVVADDVFVIIALPDRRARRATLFVDAFGDGGFEPGDE